MPHKNSLAVKAIDLSRIPARAPAGAGGWVEIHPEETAWLASAGLHNAEDFLALPGEIVSGHPDRHVLRVEIASGEDVRGFYLKREHRTRWRERWQSWRDGLGWSPKTVREGQLLRRLADEGLPLPRWAAYGEDANGRAFLLTEEVAGAFDLRRLPLEGLDPVVLAERLGRVCAELHQAGIDHPDLYAKHFLVHPGTLAITLLDWERASGSRLDLRTRIRALATLHASVADERIDRRVRLRFLWAYCRVTRYGQAYPVGTRFSWIAHAIQSESGKLLRRRGIREQRQPALPQGAQRLIWLDHEAVCAIPQVAESLRPAAMRAMLEDPLNDGKELELPGYPAVRLEVRSYRWPFNRIYSRIRRKSWRSAGLRLARLLFHLERHHVSAPRLLAYGQRNPRSGAATSFTLIEALPEETITLLRWWPSATDWDHRLMLRQLGQLLARLHEAGCSLGDLNGLAVRPDPDGETLVLADYKAVRFQRHLTQRGARTDLVKLWRQARPALGRTNAYRLACAYLGVAAITPNARELARRLLGASA